MGTFRYCRDCKDGFDEEELRKGRCFMCWIEKEAAKEEDGEGAVAVDTHMRIIRRVGKF